jgi:hypothetical protein
MVLESRLIVDTETLQALSPEEKIELAGILSPGMTEVGPLMSDVLSGMMADVATAIEPGFRAGMAKAYAVRFDADQLDDIASFFATPTGEIFARENIKLMADPQVMSATMQAMPQMMEQFGDMDVQFEQAFAELPEDRGVEDLSDEQQARMAELLGVEVGDLTDIVIPPSVKDEDQE